MRTDLILRTIFFWQVIVVACASSVLAAPPQNREQQLAFFESKIRPLLLTHCADCHGAEEQESRLRLDSPAAIRMGGASGPAVQPGKPNGSLLLTAVKQQGDLKMPPDGKLSPVEIANLETWIRNGAAMPGGATSVQPQARIDWDAGKRHWAFQPLDESLTESDPHETAVETAWPATSVDPYVLHQLRQHNLAPSSSATASVLVRRVAFDLTGLPPSQDQVDRFIDNPSQRQYRRLVDELLASPAYGERWGRHWLDVARYADSNGLDENIAHGNAWRYRDWVVTAWNRDLPFDQFVRFQLAGDLLPSTDDSQRRDQLIATGFMSLGPKVLAEVDEVKMEMDIIDEQLDTLGKSLLGLTFGCARCHDHKFDPISTRDYYSLAGILKSTRTMEHHTKIARWNESQLPMTVSEQQVKERLTESLNAEKAQLQRWEKLQPVKAGESGPDAKERAAKIKSLKAEIKKLETELAEVASAMTLGEREPTNLKVHIRGSHLTLGDEAPRRFPRVLQGDDSPQSLAGSGRAELARWLTEQNGPQQRLLARVIANRVWRWHWGRGLVASTDNFGILGERPSHPRLLDHLASELIRNDWSIKHMHRLIVLSAAYQQDSTHRDAAAKADAENQWLWRFQPRRLEAEAIRDAMLQVSGGLNRKMGGSLLHVGNREFLFNHTSKDETRYDEPVRSLYLPVIRNNLFDGFMLFDYSDASTIRGDRDRSVTAPQALFLMNAKLVSQAADALATKTTKATTEAAVNPNRIAWLFQRILSRSPSPRELKLARAFLAKYQAAAAKDANAAWAALAHSLLASNEFLYVR